MLFVSLRILVLTQGTGYKCPGDAVEKGSTLAHSSGSIMITVFVCFVVATTPLLLGIVRLRGPMPLARNSSAVMSAACHCIPERSSYGTSLEMLGKPLMDDRPPETIVTEYESSRSGEDGLADLAVGKLKWGVVAAGSPGRPRTEGEPGHLAFGSRGHEVSEPVDGSLYAGESTVALERLSSPGSALTRPARAPLWR